MTTSNQTFRQAANSPLGREAREAAKSAADTARSVGDDVSDLASDAARKAGDFATDVSRRAGRQFERWRGTAGDVWDGVHDATVRNPHLSLAIALGIGFLLGIVLVNRR